MMNHGLLYDMEFEAMECEIWKYLKTFGFNEGLGGLVFTVLD
jgi:hypothetical protein